MRSLVEPSRSRALSGLAVAALLATGVAGCSTDTTRFSENPFAARQQVAQQPPQPEYTGSIPAQRPNRVESQSLPPPQHTAGGSGGMGSYQQPQYGGAGQPQYAPPQAQYVPPQPQYAPPRQEYTGSIPQGPAPGPRQAQAPRYSWEDSNGTPPATRLAANPGYKHQGQAAGNRVHVVQPGDTIYSLGRRYHIQPMLIAQANRVGLDHKTKIGDRVIIPGGGPIASPAPAAPAPVAAAKPTPAPQPQRVAEIKPKAIPPVPTAAPQRAPVQQQGAHTITPAADPAPEPAPAPQQQATADTTNSAPSFRWPARGRVIQGFGPKTQGGQNDGINVSVPEGTPIKAAEDGVVAYSGNELKGYGNLVLIRHSNGFVTAYAHASELNVKKGEQVKRGQTIGKSGATGNVQAPQLHFEVRKGATPVDPMQYLSGG